MKGPKAHSKWVRLFFFWTGIAATFAYRIIVVLNNYSSTWVQIAWYFGTIGFIIYFAHRYQITEQRSRLIADNNLDDKIKSLRELSDQDKAHLVYILRTLRSSKEKWNYIFIFTASGIALAWGMFVDFIQPML